MESDAIVEKVRAFDCRFIEFTGGEPLEQAECFTLMAKCCELGFTVAVETGGHIDISSVDRRVVRIMDLKCPGSGMEKKNRYENIDALTKKDEVKFVIADERDYAWSRSMVEKYKLIERCGDVLFSPVFGVMDYQELAARILRDGLQVRMQLQMHKFIWHPMSRGV